MQLWVKLPSILVLFLGEAASDDLGLAEPFVITFNDGDSGHEDLFSGFNTLCSLSEVTLWGSGTDAHWQCALRMHMGRWVLEYGATNVDEVTCGVVCLEWSCGSVI